MGSSAMLQSGSRQDLVSVLFWLLRIELQALALQEGHTPIKSGVVGGILVGIIGVLLPPTMFWVRSQLPAHITPLHA